MLKKNLDLVYKKYNGYDIAEGEGGKWHEDFVLLLVILLLLILAQTLNVIAGVKSLRFAGGIIHTQEAFVKSFVQNVIKS